MNVLHSRTMSELVETALRRKLQRDTDFHRFPFLEPIDPLIAEP